MIQNSRVLTVVWSAILAVGIGLIGQGVWTAMLVANLRTRPSIPWSPVVMAVFMWMMWQFLSRKRDYLRANVPPRPVFAWALLAGALSLAALTGYWIVLTHWMGTPASGVPDLSQYPRLTTALVGLMGMLVSPLFEQAGFWGYCQVTLERRFSGAAAVAITALIFTLLPHPPLNAAWWPRLIFYFLTGLVFGTTAYLTRSILPGIVIHISGFVVFSSLVWPHDATRQWDGWAWIHAAQAILFTGLAILAFRRLKRGGNTRTPGRIRAVVSSAVLAFLILGVGSGAWITLLSINLKTSPAYPWAVPVMGAVLWLMWRYLGGKGWPRRTSETRRRLLNANPVSGRTFTWALLAGVLSIIALAGCWIVMFQLVKMPANVLPNASKYPPLTMALMVVMGSLVAPITEEAGFRGYCQGILQREFRGPAVVVVSSVLFAVAHLTQGLWWPKLLVYFLAGLVFGVTAYFTQSILPGIVVHIVGDTTFFTLVWPYDGTRPWDGWFWIHVAQAIVFAGLAVLAFRRLAKSYLSEPRILLSSAMR